MPFPRQMLGPGCLLFLVVGLGILVSARTALFASDQSTRRTPTRSERIRFRPRRRTREGRSRTAPGSAFGPDEPGCPGWPGHGTGTAGKLAESAEVFNRGLQIRPDDVTVRLYLAANLWQLHRYPEAKENLKIILRRQRTTNQHNCCWAWYRKHGRLCDRCQDARVCAGGSAEAAGVYRRAGPVLLSSATDGQSPSHLEQLPGHPAGPQAVLLGARSPTRCRITRLRKTCLHPSDRHSATNPGWTTTWHWSSIMPADSRKASKFLKA